MLSDKRKRSSFLILLETKKIILAKRIKGDVKEDPMFHKKKLSSSSSPRREKAHTIKFFEKNKTSKDTEGKKESKDSRDTPLSIELHRHIVK